MITHEIIGVIEPGTLEELTVRVKIIGSGVSFTKKPRELYSREWLTRFSSEDVAYIGFLNATVYSDGLISVDYFPRKKHRLTESVIFIAILFVCFLMMSNMTAFRVSEIKLPWTPFGEAAGIQFPAGLILFPATYAFSTILTEVYGYHISRVVIWGGLAANSLLVLGVGAVSLLPTSAAWVAHTGINVTGYEGFFSGYARTFAASSTAYFFSEFINSTLLAKLKVASTGRNKALRILASTGLAVGLDSLIFCSILFFGLMSWNQIMSLVVVQVVVKFLYELLLLPATVRVSAYLKKRDGIDYYDFDTRFNPFMIRE